MLKCAITGEYFNPRKGQGWYQAARHRPGETLQMRVVHPDVVRSGEWKPRDWMGRGPEYGCCGILEGI